MPSSTPPDTLSPLQREALNPSTTPNRLMTLASEPSCSHLVAANPNTPLTLLLSLASEHPREFSHNAAVTLKLLDDPTLLHSLSIETIDTLSSNEMNPILYPFLISAVVHHAHADFRKDGLNVIPLLNRITRAPFHVRLLEDYLEHRDPCFGYAIAHHPETSLQDLITLAQHSDKTTALFIRDRSGLTPDVFDIIATRFTAEIVTFECLTQLPARYFEEHLSRIPLPIRIALCQINTIDRDILRKFANDESPEVRKAVAANHNAPKSALRQLASDREESVMAEVAANHRTPEAVLTALAQEDSLAVLLNLAKNENVLPEALFGIYLRLKEKGLLNPEITTALAENPNSPSNLLQRLSQGADEKLFESLAINENFGTRNLGKIEPDRHGMSAKNMALAINPKTPAATLDVLCTIHDPDLILILSTRKGLTPHQFETLTSNPSISINTLLTLLKKSKCPLSIIENALQHSHESVRQEALIILKKRKTTP